MSKSIYKLTLTIALIAAIITVVGFTTNIHATSKNVYVLTGVSQQVETEDEDEYSTRTETYKYKKNGLLKSARFCDDDLEQKYIQKTKFKYKKNRIKKSFYYTYDQDKKKYVKASGYDKYTYNKNGRISKIKWVNKNGNKENDLYVPKASTAKIIKYKKNGNIKLVKHKYAEDEDRELGSNYKEKYYYNKNGKLKRVEYRSKEEYFRVIKYTYNKSGATYVDRDYIDVIKGTLLFDKHGNIVKRVEKTQNMDGKTTSTETTTYKYRKIKTKKHKAVKNQQKVLDYMLLP